MTTLEWINKATKVHNNKYTYDNVQYKNRNTKVCIICPEHGEFWQLAKHHLNGHGCRKCHSAKRTGLLTTQQFIQKAKAVHGNKYDYSKVEYNGTHTKVCIICPEHGEFYITPNNHIHRKSGCPICGNNNRRVSLSLTTNEFIQKARFIHGDRYDYSKVDYVNYNTNICIICPEHGEFNVKPSVHLTGHQCPECSGVRRLQESEWITFVKEIHGDKYDYSKVEYKGVNKKVCIICPEHGEFWQLAKSHKNGCGCKLCKCSNGESEIKTILFKNNIKFTEQHRFTDCRDKLPLSFDFYLPDLNVCIEYDGIQHYEPVEYFGGKEAFKNCQRHDQIKTEYCINNNIKLIRIRYDEKIKDKLHNLYK